MNKVITTALATLIVATSGAAFAGSAHKDCSKMTGDAKVKCESEAKK
jgi:hypothetical protein